MLGFSEAHAQEVVPIDVTLSGGDIVHWDFATLDAALAQQKEAATFRYGFLAFVVGTIAEAVAFAIEFFRPRHHVVA